MLYTYCLGLLLCVASSFALYDSSSAVVELTPSNFDRLVTNSDEIWIVEFFAPWCGHCRNLVPEYQKAAKALKGIVKVGAVDADEHKSLGSQYGVSGFPTIKIFTGSKHTPYQGSRNAEGFIDAAIKAAKDKAYENLGKKASGSSDKKKFYGHKIPWIKIDQAKYKLKDNTKTYKLKQPKKLANPQPLPNPTKPQKTAPKIQKNSLPRKWTKKLYKMNVQETHTKTKNLEQLKASGPNMHGDVKTSRVIPVSFRTPIARETATGISDYDGTVNRNWFNLLNSHLFRRSHDSSDVDQPSLVKKVSTSGEVKLPGYE